MVSAGMLLVSKEVYDCARWMLKYDSPLCSLVARVFATRHAPTMAMLVAAVVMSIPHVGERAKGLPLIASMLGDLVVV